MGSIRQSRTRIAASRLPLPNKARAIERWLAVFPFLKSLRTDHLALLKARVTFMDVAAGFKVCTEGAACRSYLMCIEGGTRTFRMSGSGRELLLYRVVPGTTCVFTTQCLLAGGDFPAECVADAKSSMAAIPADTFHDLMGSSPQFRNFVLMDYSLLLSGIIFVVDQIAFSSLHQRLSHRLLLEANADGVVVRTHQQIASDIGSVREVVTRHLSELERAGWIRTARGSLQIIDRQALENTRVRRASA